MAVASGQVREQTDVQIVGVSAMRAAPRGQYNIEPDFTASGDLQIALPALGAGARVKRASLTITGKAFHGGLRYLKGVKVTISPVVYDGTGKALASISGVEAFVIDFTGMRSVLQLDVLNNKGKITLVLPWLGTEFSQKPLYPPPSGPGPFTPIPDGGGSPSVGFAGAETTRLLVQVNLGGSNLGEDEFTQNCRIVTTTFPSNIRASLNGRPAFFSRPNVLNGDADVTGMAEDLNALLAAGPPPGGIQLTLTTDTPGVLVAAFLPSRDLETELSAEARFGGQPNRDVTLQALVAQPVPITFPVDSPRAWNVTRLALELAGQFPPWRAFPAQNGDDPGPLGLKISAQFSVARRLPFSKDGELFGCSILFRPAADSAQLHLEIVADLDGQPGPGPALAAADFPAPPAGAPYAWADVQFQSPLKVAAQKKLWMTLRVKTGSAEWAGAAQNAAETTTTLLNNEGGAWQAYPAIEGQAVVAVARVLRRPFSEENQPLLSISLTGQTTSAELGANTTAMNLDFSTQPLAAAPAGSSISLPLTVTALAAGTLSVRKAQAFYQEVTA